MLSGEHRRQRVEILLYRCQQEGDETVDVGPGGDHRARKITGDATWLHLITPETKRDSMTWKHPSSPVTKNVQSPAIGDKSDGQRVLGLTWNDPFRYSVKRRECHADRYYETLVWLRHAVRRQKPGLLRSGVVLQHDNATPPHGKTHKGMA
ncbi:histone-lysine N-methyltransferase SETMAR [Plakobranchus ocellatus]|uniref:Histone-lysine N-methyltransferase SETMAR n=1 Tax=Plakobranchus ocellatus TaxID=259542 RepID=A0AAV3YRL8_9GAST|nr:histone-lysine N-methyltransferase SETMAR [Plakobranchus ocellatus]